MDAHSTHQIHVFLLPLLAHGHMIPIIDIARLFAARGVKATIITTRHNEPFFTKAINISRHLLGIEIAIQLIEFPEIGQVDGCGNLDMVNSLESVCKFFLATGLLQEPLEKLLQLHRPDCLVADSFFPWATDSAAKFGIPRLVFHGISYLALCASVVMTVYEPHKKVSSDTEPFTIPHLPDEIKLTREQLPDFVTNRDLASNDLVKSFLNLMVQANESELKSYGVLVNSFYELEPAYADYYRKVLGRKSWHIGPVSLWNRVTGNKASIEYHECLTWLESKKPNSVIYICFGSMSNFSDSALLEIAAGIEASGQQFIWVVRKTKEKGKKEEWLPDGFEERMEGRGLIIRGWAPQVMILDHEAVGAFVTHCGWNSTLEGVSAGVPMVTWPLYAEQFYNEKLVTQVLRIGINVGAEQWVRVVGDSVKRDAIKKAVNQIMVGGEAEEMRSRAEALGNMARRAVEKGGSSYSDLSNLIKELKSQAQLLKQAGHLPLT